MAHSCVALQRGDAALAGSTMRLAIDFVLILVTVIGGRIVPAFTANALRMRGESGHVRSRALRLEFAVIGCDGRDRDHRRVRAGFDLSGALAALAALAHAIRLSGWRSFRTRGEPILWVLHVAYAWLPVGLALKACALLGGAGWAMKWQHALTMGVFATMILAVMTRASLGHTGRPLVVPRAIALAYLLLTAGTVLRVFGIAVFPDHYLLTVSRVRARLGAELRHFRRGVRTHPVESARGRQTRLTLMNTQPGIRCSTCCAATTGPVPVTPRILRRRSFPRASPTPTSGGRWRAATRSRFRATCRCTCTCHSVSHRASTADAIESSRAT